MHIERFASTCVDFVNQALDPTSAYARAAAALEMGAEEDDGVLANVTHFQQLIESNALLPAAPASRKHTGAAPTFDLESPQV